MFLCAGSCKSSEKVQTPGLGGSSQTADTNKVKKTTHGPSDTLGPCVCDVCEKRFNSLTQLKDHKRVHRSENEVFHPCIETTSTKNSLTSGPGGRLVMPPPYPPNSLSNLIHYTLVPLSSQSLTPFQMYYFPKL